MEQISQSKKVWRRFRRSKLAVFGMAVLIFFVLLSIFAPFLTDYDPNRSNLRNRHLPHPGSTSSGRTIWDAMYWPAPSMEGGFHLQSVWSLSEFLWESA